MSWAVIGGSLASMFGGAGVAGAAGGAALGGTAAGLGAAGGTAGALGGTALGTGVTGATGALGGAAGSGALGAGVGTGALTTGATALPSGALGGVGGSGTILGGSAGAIPSMTAVPAAIPAPVLSTTGALSGGAAEGMTLGQMFKTGKDIFDTVQNVEKTFGPQGSLTQGRYGDAMDDTQAIYNKLPKSVQDAMLSKLKGIRF